MLLLELFKAAKARPNPRDDTSWCPDWQKVDRHLSASRDTAQASNEMGLVSYLNDVLNIWTTFGERFGYRDQRAFIVCDKPLCMDVGVTFKVCARCCAAY
jgi:hypothetical protein